MPRVSVELVCVTTDGVAPITYSIDYPDGHALAVAHSLRHFTDKVGPNLLYALAKSGDPALADYLESVGIPVPPAEPTQE